MEEKTYNEIIILDDIPKLGYYIRLLQIIVDKSMLINFNRSCI